MYVFVEKRTNKMFKRLLVFTTIAISTYIATTDISIIIVTANATACYYY